MVSERRNNFAYITAVFSTTTKEPCNWTLADYPSPQAKQKDSSSRSEEALTESLHVFSILAPARKLSCTSVRRSHLFANRYTGSSHPSFWHHRSISSCAGVECSVRYGGTSQQNMTTTFQKARISYLAVCCNSSAIPTVYGLPPPPIAGTPETRVR